MRSWKDLKIRTTKLSDCSVLSFLWWHHWRMTRNDFNYIRRLFFVWYLDQLITSSLKSRYDFRLKITESMILKILKALIQPHTTLQALVRNAFELFDESSADSRNCWWCCLSDPTGGFIRRYWDINLLKFIRRLYFSQIIDFNISWNNSRTINELLTLSLRCFLNHY